MLALYFARVRTVCREAVRPFAAAAAAEAAIRSSLLAATDNTADAAFGSAAAPFRVVGKARAV